MAGLESGACHGHTACGAIKGAIDQVQIGNLTALLGKIGPAVEAIHYTGERAVRKLRVRGRGGAKERVSDYRRHS